LDVTYSNGPTNYPKYQCKSSIFTGSEATTDTPGHARPGEFAFLVLPVIITCMDFTEPRTCTLCGAEYDPNEPSSPYAEAGEWLAGEIWRDAGELCHLCRENRARLVMMYCHEYNT
jgi:hypothetical protein